MILGELISLGTAFFWSITVIGFEGAGKRVGSLSVNIIRLVIGLFLLTLTVFIMTGSFLPIGVDQFSSPIVNAFLQNAFNLHSIESPFLISAFIAVFSIVVITIINVIKARKKQIGSN